MAYQTTLATLRSATADIDQVFADLNECESAIMNMGLLRERLLVLWTESNDDFTAA